MTMPSCPTRSVALWLGALALALAAIAPAAPSPDDEAAVGTTTPRQLPPPIVPPKTPPPDDAPPVRKADDPPARDDFVYQRGRRLRAEPNRVSRGRADQIDALDQIDELLRAERWQAARRHADALFLEIVDRPSSSRRALRPILGRLALQRALADAQQGLWQRAAWRWSTALAIDPSIAERDLRPFGDAGRWLSSLGGPRRRGQVPEGETALKRPWPSDLDPARLTPRAALPELMVEHSEWREHPVHTVEIVVDRWGQMSHPVVLDADRAHPALIWVVLETLWQRRPAQPATRGDQRVAVVQEFLVDEVFPGIDKRGRW